MGIFPSLGLAWLRRGRAPSNSPVPLPSRQALRGWAGAGLLLLGLAVLGWYGNVLPSPVRWSMAAGLVAALAVLLAYYGERLFGPVLVYDLIRTTRRGRNIVLRCVYAGILLLVLYLSYSETLQQAGKREIDLFGTVSVPREVLADFGESFFAVFVSVQFALVILLTPFYTASAITEEKERKTLEYLFATDLANHEIILGKLAARFANLALLLLTGLPVLALLQFLGGVDPNLVLAGFAATAFLALSLASLSLLVSVYNRTTWDAVFRTYLAMFFVFFLTGFAGTVTTSILGRGGPFVNLGNPILAFANLDAATRSGLDPAEEMLHQFLEFVSWHLLLATVCAAWAVWRLRAVALKEASQPVEPEKPTVSFADQVREAAPATVRPPVSDRALMWKEMYAETDIRWRRGNPWLDGCFVIVLAVTVVVISAKILASWEDSSQVANGLLRFVGTIVASFMLLLVGVNAAGRVSRERERQTLDSLLTAPVETDHILLAKWFASVRSVRLFGWFFVWGWAIGLITGGLHILAVPVLVVAWLIYAAFCGAIGLFYSIVCGSTLRATILTLVTIFFLMSGPWLIGKWWVDAVYPSGRSGEEGYLAQGVALSPPGGLAVLTFYAKDFAPPRSYYGSRPIGYLVFPAAVGLVIYYLASLGMWFVIRRRFNHRLPATRSVAARREARIPQAGPLGTG